MATRLTPTSTSYNNFKTAIADEERYFTQNAAIPSYEGETFAGLEFTDVSLVDFYDAARSTNTQNEKDQEIKFLELFAEHRFGKSYNALTPIQKDSLKQTLFALSNDGKIDATSLDRLQGLPQFSDASKRARSSEESSQSTDTDTDTDTDTFVTLPDGTLVEFSELEVRGGGNGDPIFNEEDGGIFEVKGEAGKTYNFISDKGFQVNTLFGSPTENSPYTFIEQVGVTSELGGDFVFAVDAEGDITVDGQELTAEGVKNGDITITEQDDGTVTLTRESKENEADGYTLSLSVNSENYLDVGVATTNYGTDNVDASGLLGVTFDDDSLARNGIIQESLPSGVLAENIIIKDGKFVDKTTGAVIDDALYPTVIKFKKEGGGAIEDKNGNIVQDGTSVIGSYEVDGLFDTEFDSFTNAYGSDKSGNNRSLQIVPSVLKTKANVINQFIGGINAFASRLFGN